MHLQVGLDRYFTSSFQAWEAKQLQCSSMLYVEVTSRQARCAVCHVDLPAGQLPKTVVLIHLYISAVLQAVYSGACLAARSPPRVSRNACPVSSFCNILMLNTFAGHDDYSKVLHLLCIHLISPAVLHARYTALSTGSLMHAGRPSATFLFLFWLSSDDKRKMLCRDQLSFALHHGTQQMQPQESSTSSIIYYEAVSQILGSLPADGFIPSPGLWE